MAQSTSIEATVKSLESALESNLRLQAEIARRIQTIAHKKASNRRLASKITSQIVSTWDEVDTLRTPPVPEKLKVRSKRKKDKTDEAASETEQKEVPKKWNYDPYRRWTRRYFVDPEGSIPAPNEDIVKRRKLEEDKFFYHTCPPWSKKEVQNLLVMVSNEIKQNDGGVDTLDFDKVALKLEERMKAVDRSRPPTVKPRSGADCRLKYADTRKQTPLTKEQSMKVLEKVHLHQGSPPWSEIAADVDRSAWQCLTAYMTKLSSSRSLPFTPPEDELLLKTVAAMGPQAVWNTGAAAELAVRFFPNRSPKQVLGRLNASLVNPNNAREIWSDEEERRLVLCMKVYRDTQFPITRAAVSYVILAINLLRVLTSHLNNRRSLHFLSFFQPHFPDRSSKAVSEKWDRSLNPEYSSKPFTSSEDQTLLEAVRQAPDAGWAELARLFTSRHPRSLYHRWNEIATEEDLLLKYGTYMKQEGARRGLVKSDGLLSSDDFVVRAKQGPDEE